MGLWSGNNQTPEEFEEALRNTNFKKARVERVVRPGPGGEAIVENYKPTKKNSTGFSNARFKVGREVGFAARTGIQQQPDFSTEQEALRGLFGGGEKIWGVNNNPVTIYNDLNPSQSDPYDETASMFGIGRRY